MVLADTSGLDIVCTSTPVREYREIPACWYFPFLTSFRQVRYTVKQQEIDSSAVKTTLVNDTEYMVEKFFNLTPLDLGEGLNIRNCFPNV